MSKAPIETLSPILCADRIRAVIKEGDRYKLNTNYCLYCNNYLGQAAKGWDFICLDCQICVIHTKYSLPALWIGDLYINLYIKENNKKFYIIALDSSFNDRYGGRF